MLNAVSLVSLHFFDELSYRTYNLLATVAPNWYKVFCFCEFAWYVSNFIGDQYFALRFQLPGGSELMIITHLTKCGATRDNNYWSTLSNSLHDCPHACMGNHQPRLRYQRPKVTWRAKINYTHNSWPVCAISYLCHYVFLYYTVPDQIVDALNEAVKPFIPVSYSQEYQSNLPTYCALGNCSSN